MSIYDPNSPFYRPDKPRNGWELFKWYLFEPNLILYKEIEISEIWKILINFFFQILMPISIFIYLFSLLAISYFNLPNYFPDRFSSLISEYWLLNLTIWQKYRFLILNSWIQFLKNILIIISLYTIVIFCFAFIFRETKKTNFLFLIIFLSITAIWTVGTVGSSIFDVYTNYLLFFIILSFNFARMIYTEKSRGYKIPFGIVFSILVGLILLLQKGSLGIHYNFHFGLLGGIIVCIFYYFSFFRIHSVIFYSVRFLFNSSMIHNPYTLDNNLWYSIPWLEAPIIKQIRENKNNSIDFINFLLKNRIHNRKLIAKLIHTLQSNDLEIAINLEPGILENFYFIKSESAYYPSTLWFETFEQCKINLEFYSENKGTSPTNRKKILNNFYASLDRLEKQTQLESPKWNYFYFNGLKNLKKITKEELSRVVLSSGFNPYKRGEALNPDFDEIIFKGRKEFKNEIATKVLSSSHMHLLFIHGQRRVGKTSAIKFLERLLDDRFRVVIQDLQNSVNESIQTWLWDLKAKIERKLKISTEPMKEKETKKFSENPLQAWNEFRQFLEEVMQDKSFKLLLTIDEYENLHNFIFSKMDHSLAQQILGDIRNFSQHQNKIIFMFVGSALFTELIFYIQDPSVEQNQEISRWSNFFPQIVRVTIDYLEEDDSRDLITSPVDDLIYPEKVQKEIWKLTHGHPALIQSICGELVDRSNKNNKNNVGMDDLKAVIEERILLSDMSPFSVFWLEFCIEPIMKKTVLNLINGKAKLNQKHITRLLEHRFIEEYKKGKYRFRVKLFELWLERYGHL